jgi:hypothetical protein
MSPSTILRTSPSLGGNGREETRSGTGFESESFLRARIHTPKARNRNRREEERERESDNGRASGSSRAAAVSLRNHEFRGKLRDTLSDLPKTAHESDFHPPPAGITTWSVLSANVEHCNLNMDKERRACRFQRDTRIRVYLDCASRHVVLSEMQLDVAENAENLEARVKFANAERARRERAFFASL